MLLLAACSDPKEPTEANFAEAADAYLAQNPPCVDLEVRLPLWTASLAPPESGLPAGNLYAGEGRARESDSGTLAGMLGRLGGSRTPFQKLDLYAKHGILDRSEHEQTVVAAADGPCHRNGRVGLCFAGDSYSVPAHRYAVSPEIEEHLEIRWGRQRLCYGRYEVSEIVRFTEPTGVAGATISEVTYEYALQDVPAWATDPELRENGFEAASAEPRTDRAAFILTNQGWVHEKLYARAQSPTGASDTSAVSPAEAPDLTEAIPVEPVSFPNVEAHVAAQRAWLEEDPPERTLVYLLLNAADREMAPEVVERLLAGEPSVESLGVIFEEFQKQGIRIRLRAPKVLDEQMERAATILVERAAPSTYLEPVYRFSQQKLPAARLIYSRATSNQELLDFIDLIGGRGLQGRELIEMRELAGLRVLAANPTREETSRVQYSTNLMGEAQRIFAGKPLSAQAQARLRASLPATAAASRSGEEGPLSRTSDPDSPPLADVVATEPEEASPASPPAAVSSGPAPATTVAPAPTQAARPRANPIEQAKIKASQLMRRDPCAAARVLQPHLSDTRAAAMHRLAMEECRR